MPDAETRRGGGWNYRICRETINGEFFFTLREVYYDDDGNPNGWTADPIDFAGDTWKDVAEGISLASGCIATAILDLDTREWVKPGPKSSRRVLSPEVCSTCGGSFDSPPCSLNREMGLSGHTRAGGVAAGDTRVLPPATTAEPPRVTQPERRQGGRGRDE